MNVNEKLKALDDGRKAQARVKNNIEEIKRLIQIGDLDALAKAERLVKENEELLLRSDELIKKIEEQGEEE